MGHTRLSDAHGVQVPNRSLLRPRNLALATLAALLCGVAWLSLTAVSMARAKPGTSVDYTRAVMELRAKHSSAAGPDAFPLVRELTAERRRLEGQPASGTSSVVYYDALRPGFKGESVSPEQERETARAVLAKVPTSRMPALWDQLLACTRYDRPLSGGPLVLELLPELGEARQLARMNAARMFDATERNDHAELVRAYEQSLALARVLSYEPFTISRLVGIACRSAANSELRHVLIERRLPRDTLDALIAATERQRVTAPRSVGTQAEKLTFADFVQRTHSDNGHGNGRLLLGPLGAMLGQTGSPASPLPANDNFNIIGLALASKRETLRRGNQYYDLVIEQMDLPRPQRDAAKLHQIDLQVNKAAESNLVLKTMLPAFGKLIQSHDLDDVDTAGMRLMLEIERFRATNSRLPAALAELSKGLSPEAALRLTTDPFTGRPFGYLVLDQPEIPRTPGLHGRDYLLYSFGMDNVDNSGKVADSLNPQAALHKPEAAGTDYLINQSRTHD